MCEACACFAMWMNVWGRGPGGLGALCWCLLGHEKIGRVWLWGMARIVVYSLWVLEHGWLSWGVWRRLCCSVWGQ